MLIVRKTNTTHTRKENLMTKDHLTFACASCSSETFEKPTSPKDHDKVTCTGCGAVSTWGEIRALAMKAAKKVVHDELKRMLGKK
jgi:DNA-directed RNA polymerase subunit RPC12/RpoP